MYSLPASSVVPSTASPYLEASRPPVATWPELVEEGWLLPDWGASSPEPDTHTATTAMTITSTSTQMPSTRAACFCFAVSWEPPRELRLF